MIKAVRRTRLFVFLREHRHELFDEEFQAELAETYMDSPKAQPPVPPPSVREVTRWITSHPDHLTAEEPDHLTAEETD